MTLSSIRAIWSSGTVTSIAILRLATESQDRDARYSARETARALMNGRVSRFVASFAVIG